MTTTEILKNFYETNNRTLTMLIELLNKWNDKGYHLTDKEWDTIKYYKSLLDVYFNDIDLIQETIDDNKEKLAELN